MNYKCHNKRSKVEVNSGIYTISFSDYALSKELASLGGSAGSQRQTSHLRTALSTNLKSSALSSLSRQCGAPRRAPRVRWWQTTGPTIEDILDTAANTTRYREEDLRDGRWGLPVCLPSVSSRSELAFVTSRSPLVSSRTRSLFGRVIYWRLGRAGKSPWT